MKKVFMRICLICLSCLFIFTACTKGDDSVIKGEEIGKEPVFQATDIDFTSGGATDYSIVVPADATDNETTAVSELQYFLNLATGIVFDTIADTDAVWSEQAKYISVGDTSVREAAGVQTDYAQLLDNGYVVKRVGNSIFIAGARDFGTLNGVYGFLRHQVGYRYYAVDEFKVNDASSSKLLDFDWTDVPSFNWREVNYGEIIRDSTIMHRMRFNATEDIYVNGHNSHYSFTLIPPDEYADEHSDWFAENNTQLCYSNKEMQDEYVLRLEEVLKTNTASTVLLGHEDNVYWCDCADCTDMKNKYGTDAAVLVKFTKEVAARVNAWLAETYPERDPLNVICFAYQATVEPPVTYDEATDTYTAVDESMMFDEHTGIMFAPIGADFAVPLTHEKNADAYSQYRGWSALTDRIHLWTYSLYMNHALVLNDTFSSIQDNYKLFVSNGNSTILDQTEHFQPVSAGFGRLKAFIQANLQWNVNADMNALIDEFFVNYFKDAEPAMRRFFDELRHWNNYLIEYKGVTGVVGFDINQADFWPQNLLERWLGYIDEAYAAIEPLQSSDADTYSKLHTRITLESMGIRYLLIDNYASGYSDQVIREMKYSFYNDFYAVNLSNYSELEPIDTLWNSWGIL